MEVESRELSRRNFVGVVAGAGAAVLGGIGARTSAQVNTSSDNAPSRRVVVGVMGTSRTAKGGDGRGAHLAATLAGLPGVHVSYVCDVDDRNVPKAIESVMKNAPKGTSAPTGVKDFRKILDDKSVDGLVIATPDHWHAPAAILACSAGKHVYVEKPCCHNPREGQWLVEAAKKHNRLVQHGTQKRTWPGVREAIGRLRAGDIGRVISCKTFYYSDRNTIGKGKPAEVPSWLDWEMWQGPAPKKPFRDNYVHYNWHWFWHWGTGEIGNNGVHFIDVARWGLDVDCPKTVSYTGGKYRFPEDDQQTPDTSTAVYDFGDKLLTWENRSWGAQTPVDPMHEILFAGEKGYLGIKGGGYMIYDLKGKQIAKGSGDAGEAQHLNNFVEAIRGNATLHAPIDEGVKSVLLCHLGNISYRTGRTLHLDPQSHTITEDKEATALWGREYRPGFEPKV